jgi:hypothetical protein
VKKIYLLTITLFTSFAILGQSLVCGDTLRGYKVGANMNDSIPFFPKSLASALKLAYSDYYMLNSDITQHNDDYLISSFARFNSSITTRNNLTYKLDFPKLHINATIPNTYRDVKFEQQFKDRVFSHTVGVNGADVLLSGSVADSSGLNTTTGTCFGCNTKGMIIKTSRDGYKPNPVILTESGENPLYDGDVILKTYETANYYYAVGYKPTGNPVSGGALLPVRQGILYVIDKNVYNSRKGLAYQCATAPGNTNTGVRLFRIHSIVSDILVEPDETTLYITGTVDMVNGGRGFIGKIDLIADDANFIYYRADPFLPSPANNNACILYALERSPNTPNKFYALYRFMGNWIPQAEMGLISFDDNLNILLERAFRIDFGPGSIVTSPPGGSRWVDVFPTNLNIDQSENIYIAAYVKELLCIPSVMNCDYRHFTFVYNENYPDIDSTLRWVQNINGYRDFGFVQLDQDPFNRLGGAVNSVTTLNKLSRTVALNQAKDTVHIAYLVEDSSGTHKNVIYHYKRPTSLYLAPNQWDNCAGVLCTRENFNTTADTISMQTTEHYHYPSLNSDHIRTPNYNGGDLTHNVYEVFDCKISVTDIMSKWHEEYPVICRKRVYDSATGCDFWSGIRIHSGSDTICKAPNDTLSVIYRSPFGVNTFEWVNMRNPLAILSTNDFLIINKHGNYRVICTRDLSDGTTCSDTFFQVIKEAQDAWIESLSGANSICPGDELVLDAKPILPSAPFYKYVWNNGKLQPSIIINQPQKYYVTVTFLNGCKDVDSLEIFWASPTLSTSFSKVSGHAANEVFTMTVTACNTTNTSYLTHPVKINIPVGYAPSGLDPAWSQTTHSDGSIEISRPSLLGAGTAASPACVPHTFSLRALNPCRGEFKTDLYAFNAPCTMISKLDTVNRFRTLHPIVTPKSDTLCKRDTLLLLVQSGITGGSESPSYQWQRNEVNITGATTASRKAFFHSPSHLDRYRVLVSIGGCTQWSDTARIEFFQATMLKIDSFKVKKACFPTPDSNGRIRLYASGGARPLQYKIGNKSFQSDSIFRNLKKGRYHITVKDTNGCTDTISVFVDSLPPTAKIIDSIVRLPGCLADSFNGIVKVKNLNGNSKFDSIFFTSLSGNHYRNRASRLKVGTRWDSIPENPMDSLRADAYRIRVIDTNGCQADTIVNLSSDTSIKVEIIPRYNCDNLKSIEARATPVASYTYTWYRLRPSPLPPLLVHTGSDYVGSSSNEDLLLDVRNTITKCSRIINIQWRPNLHNPIVILTGTILTSASYTRQTINVEGQTMLNANLSFKDCRIRFVNGTGTNYAALRVAGGRTLTIDSSTLFTCTNNLAQGIVLHHTATMALTNSTINDMMRGVEFLQDAVVEISGNRFGSNAIGIQLSHAQGRLAPINASVGSIIGNTFQPTGNIKPNANAIPYGTAAILPTNASSPVHNTKGYAGIVSLATTPNSVNLTVGHNTYDVAKVNHFSNLFYGISSLGSTVQVYHPSMTNIQQILIYVPPQLIGQNGTFQYLNNFTYPTGMTPMEGTGVLMYHTTPQVSSPRSTLTVQSNRIMTNFNSGVFRCIDVRDAHVTVSQTRMNAIYNGFHYQRASNSAAQDIVNFTDNTITDKAQANGDMASAISIRDFSVSNNTFARYDIARNDINTIATNSSTLYPIYGFPGSGDPQPLVHIQNSMTTLPTATIGSTMTGVRLFRHNFIQNRGVSNTAVKFTNAHRFTSQNNEVRLSDGLLANIGGGSSSLFRACFVYDNCRSILESGNIARSTALISGIFTVPISIAPAGSPPQLVGIFPVGFNYINTQSSSFSCNEAHRGLRSSVLFEGNCTNSFLISANLNATSYGIVIPDNTTITQHVLRGNKFYCGSHIVGGGMQHHILRSISGTGTGILFTTRHMNTSLSGCTHPSPPNCYQNLATGSQYVLRPSSIAASIMTNNSVSSAANPEVPTCPICIPLPKLASATPLSSPEVEATDCTLFPNPMSTDATVELDQPVDVAMSVRILDMTGRVLLDDTIEAGAKEYKLKGDRLSTGIYQVVVFNGKEVYCTKKLVVER